MKRIAISICMFLSALLVSSQVNTDRVMMERSHVFRLGVKITMKYKEK